MNTSSFIISLLSTGIVSTLVTWLLARRKRNNDFLGELQKSIDLLSEKYNAVLRENVQLNADNAELLAAQRRMEVVIAELNSKIDALAAQLDAVRSGERHYRPALKQDLKTINKS